MLKLRGYPTDSSTRFIRLKHSTPWLDGSTDDEDPSSTEHALEEGQGIRKRQHLESFLFSDWNEIVQRKCPIPSKVLESVPSDCLAFDIASIFEQICVIDGGPSVNQLSSPERFTFLVKRADIQVQLQQHLKNGRFDLAVYLLDKSYSDRYDHHKATSVDPEIWGNLFRDWTRKYHGKSLEALREKLVQYETITQESSIEYYSKSIAIIQSSGAGKSRLTSELGKSIFSLVFTLRDENSTGYPPGDTEVYRFLTQESNEFQIHCYMFALLGSALRCANEWLLDQNANVRGRALLHNWHNEMLPGPLSMGESQIDTRSKARKTFCTKVVSSAEVLYEVFSKDKELMTAIAEMDYTKMKDLKVVEDHLQNYAIDFMDTINNAIASTTDRTPLIAVWVFDEVANLDPPDTNAIRFTALRRAIQSLEAYPLWSLFLSTNSGVHRFAAPRRGDSSERVKIGDLHTFQPFFAFPIDLELTRRMDNRELRQQELKKPISQFSSGEHMSMFGRPLWYTYANLEPVKLKKFVAYKLLHGNWISSGPGHRDQVFALLASRLCLDPCMNKKEAIELAKDAVDFHLRLVTGYDSEHGLISTATPSEPLVADAATDILMKKAGRPPEYIWRRAILTMVNELLSKGLVSIGTKGELYARLILVLTCDFTRENAIRGAGPDPFPFSRPFLVTDFFKQLFGEKYETVIARSDFNQSLPGQTSQKVAPKSSSFTETFRGAIMNFTHFTYSTRRLLEDQQIGGKLLHQLLRRNQALKLCESQEYWDLLIPMYFGSCDEDFDTSKVSLILIQVKNCSSRNFLPINWKGIKNRFPVTQPIIQILLDIEADSDELCCRYWASPTIYSITARGRSQATFGCLSHEPRSELANACMRLLEFGSPTLNHLEEEIIRGNCGVQFPIDDIVEEEEDSDGESRGDTAMDG